MPDCKNALRLYAVTDRSWLGESTLFHQVEQALRGGATLLQLREKELPLDQFVSEAIEIKALCDRYQVPLMINDSVEVALRCGAQGVHVGQSDMQAARVRELLGPDKLIGVSARTLEEARLAQEQGADYLGVGAVFSTSTKLDARAVSHDTLRQICEAVSIPVVAIGGINASNVEELSGCGVDGVAVVSAIFAAEDPGAATEHLKTLAAEMVSHE